MILPTIPAPPHPPAVLTPAQRAGLRYQRRVGRWLRGELARSANSPWDLVEGPWLAGPAGPCSPDFVLVPRTGAVGPGAACADTETPLSASPGAPIVILEAKLTQCDCALQLSRYRRALEEVAAVAATSVVAIQVCRRVLTPPTVRTPEDFTHDGHMLLWI